MIAFAAATVAARAAPAGFYPVITMTAKLAIVVLAMAAAATLLRVVV